jgi:hypothetical protein
MRDLTRQAGIDPRSRAALGCDPLGPRQQNNILMMIYSGQNIRRRFFCRPAEAAPARKSPTPLFEHFSTNLDSVKGKSGEWLRNNHKTLKRRGLRRSASSLRKAKEAAAMGLAWQTKAVRRIQCVEK